MRIGLHLVAFDWPGGTPAIRPTLTRIARAADDGGYASLWVMDHYFQLGERYGTVHGPVDAPMLEGPTTIGFLAGITERLQLGLLVACNLYRQPAALVKAMTTVDVLSGGRSYFGIGAGWFDREALGLGFGRLPGWTERIERLEEAIEIARRMWSDSPDRFEGRYYQLEEPINSPPPIRRPHPPILIGGDGDRMLRRVARLADACNLVIPGPLEEFGDLYADPVRCLRFVRERLAFLREACDASGRPYDQIEKTMATYVRVGRNAMSTTQLRDFLAPFAEAGIEHAMLIIPDAWAIDPIETIASEVLPELALLDARPGGSSS